MTARGLRIYITADRHTQSRASQWKRIAAKVEENFSPKIKI